MDIHLIHGDLWSIITIIIWSQCRKPFAVVVHSISAIGCIPKNIRHDAKWSPWVTGMVYGIGFTTWKKNDQTVDQKYQLILIPLNGLLMVYWWYIYMYIMVYWWYAIGFTTINNQMNIHGIPSPNQTSFPRKIHHFSSMFSHSNIMCIGCEKLPPLRKPDGFSYFDPWNWENLDILWHGEYFKYI